MHPAWALQDAKNQFSELVETALREGPQTVTRRGQAVVVVVPLATWEATQKPAPRLKDWLVRPGLLDDVTLERDREPARVVDLS